MTDTTQKAAVEVIPAAPSRHRPRAGPAYGGA